MALTKTAAAYSQIEQNLKGLLEGVMISIDPSIGSTSSQPGFAVFRQTKQIDSGILTIPPHLSVPVRLRMLANHLRKLYRQYQPDVLVYEEIPSQRYGGGNANAHASLLKAVGAILSVAGPDGYVGLSPLSWKRMVRDTYRKGDKEDAEEIGYIAIECAKQITETKQTKRKPKSKA